MYRLGNSIAGDLPERNKKLLPKEVIPREAERKRQVMGKTHDL